MPTNSDNNRLAHSNVWYRSGPALNNQLRMLVFDDAGSLTVSGERLEFRGRFSLLTIRLSEIKELGMGKGALGNWVRLEYDNGKVAYFADGGMFGLSGPLGGTVRLFGALRRALGK